jgi:hypothetical protein
MSPVLKYFSTTVRNQIMINNIVSSILKSYRIQNPKLHYVDIHQEYNQKRIDADRKLIQYLKKHPVVLSSSLLDYEKLKSLKLFSPESVRMTIDHIKPYAYSGCTYKHYLYFLPECNR